MDHRTTTERELGWEHQRLRRALLPHAYGKDCPMCGQTMERGQQLHLDHPVPRVLGGVAGEGRIVHALCNLRAGQALGLARRMRRDPQPTRPHSEQW